MNINFRSLLTFGIAAASLCLLLAGSQAARAQSVTWGSQVYYDWGYTSKVSLYGTNIIEVHEDGAYSGLLFYRTGKISNGQIQWQSSTNFANGYNPDVSLSGTTFVIAYEDGNGNVVYTNGKLSRNTLNFSSNTTVIPGYAPAVHLSGASVVEEHQASNSTSFWSTVGTLKYGVFTWNASQQYDDGYTPSISHYKNLVVEVHEDGAYNGNIWMRIGTIKKGTIVWNSASHYDHGYTPSVSLYGSPVSINLVEVHEDGSNNGLLWYYTGQLTSSGQFTAWNGPTNYASGSSNPSVSLYSTAVVEVNNDPSATKYLYSMLGAW